jgi:c-di-GMP-related signal transduction protein
MNFRFKYIIIRPCNPTIKRESGGRITVENIDAKHARDLAGASWSDGTTFADIYLGRQPIVDRSGALTGYELLFRRNVAGVADVTDGDQASAQVMADTLAGFGIARVLNGHPGFLNVGPGLLMSETLKALPTDGFVLEILENVVLDDAAIARCHALHAAGYRLALDDVSPQRAVPERLLGAIDIVKVDLAVTPAAALPGLIGRFRRAGKTVLAEKVETREAFQRTALLGCELFQGYFFARPEVLASRKPRGSQMPLLRLLKVLSGEPELDALEEALKANPDIVMQVFRFANAAGVGAREPIHTLREAILRVGTMRITRLAQLLLYAQGCNMPLRANPLLQLVGTRARLMELAALRIAAGEPDAKEMAARAFLAGMLSLAHVLLQCDSALLLEQLQISPVIRSAIERREGRLSELLAFAEAVEAQEEETLEICTSKWPVLDRGTIVELGINAAHWVARQTESSM